MKKIYILSTSILLLCSIIIFISLRTGKTFFPRENEVKVYDENKINKMIENLEIKLSHSPEDTNVMVELGIYYFIKGPQFYDKAINLLYQSWRLGSTDIRIFYYLGCMYDFLKLYVLASEEYKKFLSNAPKDVEVLIRMGNVLYKLNRTKDAIEYYTKALNVDKDNILSLTNLGYIYFAQKDVNNALECFTKVIKVSKRKKLEVPKNVNFYIGKIFFDNKNYETAKHYFLTEYEKYPDNVENSLLLVKTYYYLNDYEKSYELARQLIEIIPENRELANLYRDLKRRLQ